jgi:hypothetical protein
MKAAKIREAASLGTKHMHNVKAAMQFAFNTSIMTQAPASKSMEKEAALKMLEVSCNSSETRFDIAQGAAHVTKPPRTRRMAHGSTSTTLLERKRI